MKKHFLFLLLACCCACAPVSDLKLQTLNDLEQIPRSERTYAFHTKGYIQDVRFEKRLEKVLAGHHWRNVPRKQARYIVYFSFVWPLIETGSRVRSFGATNLRLKRRSWKTTTASLEFSSYPHTFFMSVRENKKIGGEPFGQEVFSAVLYNERNDFSRDNIEFLIEQALSAFLSAPDTTKYYRCGETDGKDGKMNQLFFGKSKTKDVPYSCIEVEKGFSEETGPLYIDIEQ